MFSRLSKSEKMFGRLSKIYPSTSNANNAASTSEMQETKTPKIDPKRLALINRIIEDLQTQIDEVAKDEEYLTLQRKIDKIGKLKPEIPFVEGTVVPDGYEVYDKVVNQIKVDYNEFKDETQKYLKDARTDELKKLKRAESEYNGLKSGLENRQKLAIFLKCLIEQNIDKAINESKIIEDHDIRSVNSKLIINVMDAKDYRSFGPNFSRSSPVEQFKYLINYAKTQKKIGEAVINYFLEKYFQDELASRSSSSPSSGHSSLGARSRGGKRRTYRKTYRKSGKNNRKNTRKSKKH